MGCRVETAAPGGLAPSFWIAVARVSPAGGALAGEDEVDPAKVGRGVKAGASGVVVSSTHDRLPCRFCLEAGRAGGWQSDRSIELIPAPKRFVDEVARAGGGGVNSKRCLATPEAMRSAALMDKNSGASAGAESRRPRS